MGKSSADKAAGRAADAQSRLAQQLVSQTDSLRQGLIGDANQFISGGRSVAGLPEFQAAKSIGEGQFANARDNIIASTPEGGALTAALAGLDADKARAFTEVSGGIAGNEVDRALQLATFGAAQGSAGLGGAGMVQAQRAAAESQSNAAKGTAVGTAVGFMVGGKPGAAAGGAAGSK